MTFANKARSRIRDMMWACEEEEERQDSLRVVKVEEMSRGKGWYICEHHVCAYKSRYMKAALYAKDQSWPSDDGQKLNISMLVVDNELFASL